MGYQKRFLGAALRRELVGLFDLRVYTVSGPLNPRPVSSGVINNVFRKVERIIFTCKLFKEFDKNTSKFHVYIAIDYPKEKVVFAPKGWHIRVVHVRGFGSLMVYYGNARVYTGFLLIDRNAIVKTAEIKLWCVPLDLSNHVYSWSPCTSIVNCVNWHDDIRRTLLA